MSKSPRVAGFRTPALRDLAIPAAIGLLAFVLTRWVVVGFFAVLAAATLPKILKKTAPGAGSARAEAVASWTELIRDSLAASAGIAQAIVVTVPSAPLPIQPQVSQLAFRLNSGVPMTTALRSFAAEVADPAAEFLVCSLLLAADSRAQKLVDVLTALAVAIREEVAMRLRVDASRAAARSSVRTIVAFSLAFATILMVIAHSYLQPFGTLTGQLVLAVVGACYAGGLALMAWLVRPQPAMPLLDWDRAP